MMNQYFYVIMMSAKSCCRLARGSIKPLTLAFVSSSCLFSTHSKARCSDQQMLLSPASIASVKGGRDYMEDEYSISEEEKHKLLAVYDGHAGKDVSKYMKAHFPTTFEEALEGRGDTASAVIDSLSSSLAAVDKDMLTGPLSRRLHSQGATSCIVYLDTSPSLSSPTLPPVRSVVTANVGDSRAVLCRGGTAVDLTEDHKPDLPSERERVEGLGGRITWHGRVDKAGKPIESTGVYRVNGNLALSRSMGDRYMRPYVTSEPDFKQLPVTEEDEFIVVATDGLWDVLTSQQCVTLIRQVVEEHSVVPKEVNGLSPEEKRAFAALHQAKIIEVKSHMARIITEVALRRGSTDNITVLVQWLK